MRVPSSSHHFPPEKTYDEKTYDIDRIRRDGHNFIHALPTADALAADRPRAASERRFVAGNAFFNYEEFGSLRPGLPTIELFSRPYIGFAIHTVLLGFAFYFFSYGYGRLLAQYLKASSETQVLAAKYVLAWPQALSIFIGLISDCYPIRGYRRKSYMVIGWSISLASYVTLIVLDMYGNSGEKLFKVVDGEDRVLPGVASTSKFETAFLLFSLLAAIGNQTGFIAAMAASVEYAQREHLHYRGRLQCTLLLLYLAGGLVAYIVIAAIISGDKDDGEQVVSTISIATAATVLSIVSIIAIPFVVLFFDEARYVPSERGGNRIGRQLQEFWKFCHQNVVYRVLFFIVLQLFLIGLYNQNVRDASREWSGVTAVDSVTIDVPGIVVSIISLLLWNAYMRNTSWRKLAVIGSAAFLVLHGVNTVFSTYNIVRNKYFFGSVTALIEFPRVWLLLFSVILATEIADVGKEGMTLALGITYRTLGGLADYTIAAILPSIMGFKVSKEDVANDDATTRGNVMAAFAIVSVFNLLSFALILALPEQKLDAQQQRAFGGYNRFASTGLLVIFCVLLVFNLTANLVALL